MITLVPIGEVEKSVNVKDKLIYTLGTSTRSREEFIKLLSSHGVAVVVDVRRFLSSRFEHFRREKLEGLLSEAGIDYIYMGRSWEVIAGEAIRVLPPHLNSCPVCRS